MSGPLNTTIIAVSSYRGVEPITQNCIARCLAEGALFCDRTGCADVALARNLVLTDVLDATEQEHRDRDTVLCVDDDMVFTVADALAIVNASKKLGRAVTAAYATGSSHFHCSRRYGVQWEAGLGFMAIPIWALRQLAARMPRLGTSGTASGIYPLCKTGLHPTLPTRWTSEDYWLCRELGGVVLDATVRVGHLKTCPIYPDDETMRRLNDGEDLDPVPPKVQGANLDPATGGTELITHRGRR